MNSFEAGTISGISTGLIIGGIFGQPNGATAVVCYAMVGAIGGSIVGWLYAFVVIFLVSLCSGRTPDENRLTLRITRAGVFAGVITGGFFMMNWLHALIAMFVVAAATAVGGFIQIQFLRKKSKP